MKAVLRSAFCALRLISDDRSDALGGLGRAAAGADRLAGHGAPLSDAERLRRPDQKQSAFATDSV
jgi:hypothetical protein